jgi:benzaldehyde dehydrogenase (NAD)
MALMDGAVWRGQIYSGGWVDGGGGDAAVIEPATGAELGRTGIATPADVSRAAQLAAAAQPAWAATPHTFTDTRWVTIRGDIAPYPF